MPRLGNRDAEVGCYIGQYAHHHIFGDSESEGAQREGVETLMGASSIHFTKSIHYFFAAQK